MIPPHIESIPSLLVIKVHNKVLLIFVYYVVPFLACVACSVACENIRRSSSRNVPSGEERGETDVFAGYMQRGAEWREKGGGLGREYTRGRGGHKY